MMETIKYATISNIYIKDLIFYQEGNELELINFCDTNGISYLPDKDRKSIFKLENNDFIKVPLSSHLTCQPFDRLFDLKTLSKFENGDHDEVLFVVEDKLIKGVVHLVDYNDDFLNLEFYKASYYFERMLRDFLVKRGENNQTLLKWMSIKGKESKYWENRYNQCVPINNSKRQQLEQKRKDLKAFQTFYLNDLLFFAASKALVSNEFKQNIEGVKQVRNWVAHSKDLTHRSNEVGKPLYKINDLKNFVDYANQFFECYEELEFKLHEN